MLIRISSIIFVTTYVITMMQGQDTPNKVSVPADENVLLDRPICILTDYKDEKELEFKIFAKYEECQFQRFMDEQHELDCQIMYRIENGQTCSTEKCRNAVFETREKLYTYRLNLACACENPRNSDEKSQGFEYFDVVRTEGEIKRISTYCEYSKCWQNLWKGMRTEVKKELDRELNNGASQSECRTIGQKHEDRCESVTFNSGICTV